MREYTEAEKDRLIDKLEIGAELEELQETLVSLVEQVERIIGKLISSAT